MENIKGIRYCKVIDINEAHSVFSANTDMDLIKVRISPDDDGIDEKDLPWAFPLLPKMIHIKPKVGEGVFVILTELDKAMGQRYYIGPVISQDNKIFMEEYLYSSSYMKGSPYRPDIAPSTNSDYNGILPNDDDVVLRGRKNADLQITDDDVRIKAGVKKVRENNKYDMYDMSFNIQDPAYVKIKYHPNGIVKSEYEVTTYNKNDKRYEVKVKEQPEQVMSTVTVVADKINLFQNNSKEKSFTTTDRTDLITDDELRRALDEAYKLPYGEKLVEILSLFINAFIKHTHPFSMFPPCNADGIPELKDMKTTMLDNGKLLSDTVRFN